MAGYAIGDKVLDGWEIVRLIGEGGYGRVFEVRKELAPGSWTRSALKVVSIPPSDSLVTSALAEGASREAVVAEYREIADSFMAEAGTLSSLSHPGVVGYQDHQRIPHPDGIGWDILLRMELLEPLTNIMATRPLDAGETVRLGAELADALAFCHARGIIHRDVKPENVFADASGRYKLGDFGVSRTVEGTAGTLSRKGTEDYMAPELYYEHRYGAPVDVYALGLVLYRLLNGNRLPFLPPAPQPVRYADRQAAQRRRLSGEPFPRPAGCDPGLFAIVDRACAYDPASRPSAAELRDALWAYGRARGVSSYSGGAAKTSGAASAQPASSTDAGAAAFRTQNVWSAFGTHAAPSPEPKTAPAKPKTASVPKAKAAPAKPKTPPAPKAAPMKPAAKPAQTMPQTPPAPRPKPAPVPKSASSAAKYAVIGILAFVFLLSVSIALSAGSCSKSDSTSTYSTESGSSASSYSESGASSESSSYEVPLVDATNGSITLTGTLTRSNMTTSQTGMGWSAVVYWLRLDEDTAITYNDAWGNENTAVFERIVVAQTEQDLDDADKDLDSISLPEWEPYLNQRVTVRGEVFDTGNAHTIGNAAMHNASIV